MFSALGSNLGSRERLVVLEAFDHANNIFDFIAMKQPLKETVEALGALSDHVLDLSHQRLLASEVENHDFKRDSSV